jgi:DNA helicase-2/ATP-dependent DNA helicase PcrA
MNYEKELNQKQYEAVSSPYQHLRIVAGAGSGKTRVLTYRIAYLIEKANVKPWHILAFTFTNKVANEMKERVERLVPSVSGYLSIRTFHSFAAFFLRQEISILGYPSSFTILDEEDQEKIVKDIAAEMGFKRSDEIVKRSLSYIGGMKLHEKYPEDIHINYESFPDEKTCLKIYQLYEDQKSKMYALDFDDLLLWTNNILSNFPDVRTKWQNKTEHILVDEFQDTNDTEFKMLMLLKKPSTYLYVVGDPDQTIYTWRGANQKIIMELDRRFPDIQTVILDKNYRSTKSILEAANKLIAHNRLRIKKDLYTDNIRGDAILTKGFMSSRLEAEYVAKEILRLVGTGRYTYRDIVLLYRSNYITLDFEQVFTSYQIPYRIYGGLKFYQRKEVKDVLAYFRLIVNIRDDVSFERIINVPKRGIGEASIAKLKNEASEAGQSLYEFVSEIDIEKSDVPRKVLNALKVLVKRIDIARDDVNKNEEVFSKTLEDLISEIGYYDYLLKEEDGDDRIDNVKAIFQDLRNYLKRNPEATFDEYLQNIALISAQDEVSDGQYVTMMTAHTAKGLEFPVVFLVRFNNGVFPNQRALQDSGFIGLEEERRLAYVAMTRAMQKLYVTFNTGFSYVTRSALNSSDFIKEAGIEIKMDSLNRQTYSSPFSPYRSATKDFDDLDYENNSVSFDETPHGMRDNTPIKQDFSNPTNGIDDWKVGDKITHKKFGDGTVIALEGDDIIKVEFDDGQVKSLMGTHPSISKKG